MVCGSGRCSLLSVFTGFWEDRVEAGHSFDLSLKHFVVRNHNHVLNNRKRLFPGCISEEANRRKKKSFRHLNCTFVVIDPLIMDNAVFL